MTTRISRMTTHFRPIAIVGFIISMVSLLVLLAYCFDRNTRGLLVAQFTPGLIWHLPLYVNVFTRTFMILNLPVALVGEVVVRTIAAGWKPEYRALINFIVWWVLSPAWWWLVGSAGYRGKDRLTEEESSTA